MGDEDIVHEDEEVDAEPQFLSEEEMAFRQDEPDIHKD